MVTNDLFSMVWRNVLRQYVRGLRLVEYLTHRYGFGRLRLSRRWHDPITEEEIEYLANHPPIWVAYPNLHPYYLQLLGLPLPE
jgi:hypothetical protein